MSFLHKLWDETLAGPAPETGLGKLRKYNSFSASRSPPPLIITPVEIPVSRRITILRVKSAAFRNASEDSGSVPSSPEGSSTPTSPFSKTTPEGDFKRLTRRKSTLEPLERPELSSPTVYDWLVISALDS